MSLLFRVTSRCARWGCFIRRNSRQRRLSSPAQHIDPWNVKGDASGKIDYNKLVEQVGMYRHGGLHPSPLASPHASPAVRMLQDYNGAGGKVSASPSAYENP